MSRAFERSEEKKNVRIKIVEQIHTYTRQNKK